MTETILKLKHVDYLCQITGILPLDPVIASDCKIYDRKAIALHLETSDISPVTGEILPNKILLSLPFLSKTIADLRGMVQKKIPIKTPLNFCSIVNRNAYDELLRFSSFPPLKLDSDSTLLIKFFTEASLEIITHYIRHLFFSCNINYLIDLYHFAIKKGLMRVVKIIYQEKKIDAMLTGTCKDMNALNCAAAFNRLDIMKFLLSHMKSKEEILKKINGDQRFTPWTDTICFGSRDVCEYFIDLGMDVNARRPGTCTPLDSACFNGKVEIVKLLLDRGAMLNSVNCGVSPLISAIRNKKVEVVELLVRRGAILFSRGSNISYLLQAFEVDDFGIFKALVEEMNLDQKVSMSSKLVAYLIKKYEISSKMVKDLSNLTEVHSLMKIAFYLGNPQICEWFLDEKLFKNGVPLVTILDPDAQPLNWAISMNNLSLTGMLIERGLPINGSGLNSNVRPIHIAVLHGYIPMVKLLIEKGACINLENDSGCLPICLAVGDDNVPMVKLLLESGSKKCKNKKMTWDFSKEIADLISSYPYKIPEASIPKIKLDHIEGPFGSSSQSYPQTIANLSNSDKVPLLKKVE